MDSLVVQTSDTLITAANVQATQYVIQGSSNSGCPLLTLHIDGSVEAASELEASQAGRAFVASIRQANIDAARVENLVKENQKLRDLLYRVGLLGGSIVNSIPSEEISFQIEGREEKVLAPSYGWVGRENCQSLMTILNEIRTTLEQGAF